MKKYPELVKNIEPMEQKKSASCRSYLSVKSPRLPKAAELSQKNTHVTSIMPEGEASHMNHYLPKKNGPGKSMQKKVQSIKNYSSLVRKAQKTNPSEKLTSQVSVLNEKTEAEKEDQKQDELWRDMMKTNEERHFRITRITNYFT